jgi:hypothetical protein
MQACQSRRIKVIFLIVIFFAASGSFSIAENASNSSDDLLLNKTDYSDVSRLISSAENSPVVESKEKPSPTPISPAVEKIMIEMAKVQNIDDARKFFHKAMNSGTTIWDSPQKSGEKFVDNMKTMLEANKDTLSSDAYEGNLKTLELIQATLEKRKPKPDGTYVTLNPLTNQKIVEVYKGGYAINEKTFDVGGHLYREEIYKDQKK